jgi:hypothetical protein
MARTASAGMTWVMLAAVLAALPGTAFAGGPQPPCRAIPGGDPATFPTYGAMDGPPSYGIWHVRDLQRDGWQPPACLGWYGDSRLVVALAARFHSPATIGEFAERLGGVSRFPAIKFWAITRQAWHPLAQDAFVVASPKGGKMRLPDPAADALVAGRGYFYAEDADVAGRAIYRMRVIERTADRLVMASENVTSITMAILTLFPPASLQVMTFIDRHDDGWAAYEITRAAFDASSMVASYQSSYLNRLEAVRRALAGIPTDRDPPIARW